MDTTRSELLTRWVDQATEVPRLKMMFHFTLLDSSEEEGVAVEPSMSISGGALTSEPLTVPFVYVLPARNQFEVGR